MGQLTTRLKDPWTGDYPTKPTPQDINLPDESALTPYERERRKSAPSIREDNLAFRLAQRAAAEGPFSIGPSPLGVLNPNAGTPAHMLKEYVSAVMRDLGLSGRAGVTEAITRLGLPQEAGLVRAPGTGEVTRVAPRTAGQYTGLLSAKDKFFDRMSGGNPERLPSYIDSGIDQLANVHLEGMPVVSPPAPSPLATALAPKPAPRIGPSVTDVPKHDMEQMIDSTIGDLRAAQRGPLAKRVELPRGPTPPPLKPTTPNYAKAFGNRAMSPLYDALQEGESPQAILQLLADLFSGRK